MSNFAAIWAVSNTLQQLLIREMKLDPQFVTDMPPVILESPKAVRASNSRVPASSISLWLYRVARNEYTLNAMPTRTSASQVARPGVPVNLHYLITPMNEDPQIQQTILGKVLQIFNDHAILRGGDLQASLRESTEELRLSLETLSLEELTRVWSALIESYQLSISYIVQVIMIESGLEPIKAPPVESRIAQ